ncbi:hypothetical protein HY450_00150 [Candidatus Pacearchaeota archaeon]|nr:hypothetical protein [Candidatus Pacearchaeota archaeon]
MKDRSEEQRKLEELVKYYYESAGKSGLGITSWSNDINQGEDFNIPVIWTSVTHEPEYSGLIALEFDVDYTFNCKIKPNKEGREEQVFTCHQNGDVKGIKKNLTDMFGLEAYICRIEPKILLNHYGLKFDFPDQTNVISVVMERHDKPDFSSMLREDEMTDKNEQEILNKLRAPLLSNGSQYRFRMLRTGNRFDNGDYAGVVVEIITMGFAMLKDEELHEALESARDTYT